ncbi:MAG: hypothetical protein JWO77_3444 [Ilumatobacteraceae bacterium]|nr:hypothetical protein [Ilumatobacteraceae bacterium]
MITIEQWRRYPFSLRRRAVFCLEVAVAVAIAWRASTAWVSWAGTGLILLGDYLWTCAQVRIGSRRPSPPSDQPVGPGGSGRR